MKAHVFLAHAAEDHVFAGEAAEFLESGCGVMCNTAEGMIVEGEELPEKAAEGLSADVLLLLLSEAACGAGWKRERWEPVLQQKGNVVSIALEESRYPGLLRRQNFFDATVTGRRGALRGVKRFLRLRERPGEWAGGFSQNLEELYTAVGDRPGIGKAGAEAARRFAREAAADFDAVIFLAVEGRSLAEVSGQLGAELGLVLEGTAEENCRTIREVLSRRRCLVAMDVPVGELIGAGRTSVLIIDEAPDCPRVPETLAGARSLLSARRHAEGYELLYRLMNAGISVETCARELAWICDSWNRTGEAEELRDRFHLWRGEQMTLWPPSEPKHAGESG